MKKLIILGKAPVKGKAGEDAKVECMTAHLIIM